MMLRHTLIGLLLSGLLISPAQARIYQYVDDSGRKIFVDRLNKVPARYRDQLEVREEERDQLSPELLNQRKQQRQTDQFRLRVSRQRNQIKEAMQQWVTPYRFVANRISLPVKLVYGARSVELELVMDTGASYTVVHKHAISSLGAQLRPGAAARIADGSVVQTSEVIFDRVEIGPYKAKNVRAGVIDFQGGVLPVRAYWGWIFCSMPGIS